MRVGRLVMVVAAIVALACAMVLVYRFVIFPQLRLGQHLEREVNRLVKTIGGRQVSMVAFTASPGLNSVNAVAVRGGVEWDYQWFQGSVKKWSPSTRPALSVQCSLDSIDWPKVRGLLQQGSTATVTVMGLNNECTAKVSVDGRAEEGVNVWR